MNNFIDFFTNIPPWFRATILMGGIIFFWILEGIIPLFKSECKKLSHAGVNLFFTLTILIIGLFFASILLYASDTVSAKQFGLLYVFDLPL